MTCTCAVPYRSARSLAGYRPLGALGVSAGDAAKGVGVSVASKAAGGAVGSAAVSSGLVAAGGLALGAVTLGVGLVVAFALGKLLTKNYLNVPQMNAAEDQDVAAYNQYLTVMGMAPGRAFGLDAMLAVWRGANHSGLFPKNNGRQCFHEGCSKYPGRADWINGFVSDYGVHGNINFPDAWYRFQQDRNAADFGPLTYNPHPMLGAPASTYQAANTPPAQPPGSGLLGTEAAGVVPPAAMVQVVPPTVGVRVATPTTPTGGFVAPVSHVFSTAVRMAPQARGALRGLGDTSASPGGQADAVNFIDNFLLPYNQAHGTWVVPGSATERQILYDVADAFLAGKGITTVPYIGNPQGPAPIAQVAPVTVPPQVANTMMPNYSPVPVPPSAQPVYPPVPTPAMPVQYAVPPPESSQPLYGLDQLPPGTVAAASVGTAGLSNIPTPVLAIAAALLLVSFALARPASTPGRKSKP